MKLITLLCLLCLNTQASSLYERVKEVEFSTEVLATYSTARGSFQDILKNDFDHGKFGTGLALNAFFGEHVGVKVDSLFGEVDNVEGSTIDYSSASFVLRFPTVIHVNPYALAGLGRNWDSERWNTHVGVGIGYQLTDQWAVTTEFRHVFESRRLDYDQVRLGLNYKF